MTASEADDGIVEHDVAAVVCDEQLGIETEVRARPYRFTTAANQLAPLLSDGRSAADVGGPSQLGKVAAQGIARGRVADDLDFLDMIAARGSREHEPFAEELILRQPADATEQRVALDRDAPAVEVELAVLPVEEANLGRNAKVGDLGLPEVAAVMNANPVGPMSTPR